MPLNPECLPVRVKIRLQALVLWLALSLPSLLVTLILYSSSADDVSQWNSANNAAKTTADSKELDLEEDKDGDGHESLTEEGEEYSCYENYTIYFPVYIETRFWIEGILLFGVGLLGAFGNLLTMAVLRKSKHTKFNRLLIFLSITDTVLIVFFLLMSSCTVLAKEPQWFVLIFPYLLWPLGNIAITASVLMVVAVSTERFLAICRPLQYKPSPGFYVSLVLLISVAVNLGKFFEYQLVRTKLEPKDNETSTIAVRTDYKQTTLMQDERYIIFSRYWTEIVVIGILPILALIMLNYGIYVKIRKSTKFRKLHDKSCAAPTLARPATCRLNSKTTTLTLNEITTNSSPQRRPCTPHSLNNTSNKPTSSNSERSTKLLVGIVLVFFVCHCFRLVLQFDAVVHPSILGGQHFEYCMNRGRFPSPFIVWIMTSFNNVFLVLNSSINFVVYCLMGRSFRNTLIDLFRIK